MHRAKSADHQGSHCPSPTCQAGLRAETNIELVPHGPKMDKRPPPERQTSALQVTHLLRVILQFQTISSFFAFSLKRIVKNHKKHYTGQRTAGWVWRGAQQFEHDLKADPTSTVSLGDEEGWDRHALLHKE